MKNSNKAYLRRINHVTDHIKKNLDGDLSLERLSNIAHFSKFYFHRTFKAVMGENINAYINRLRLEKSAFMLLFNPNQSVTSIAYASGFSSPSVFSRAFKAFYKLPPSQWRAKQKSKICTLARNHREVDTAQMFYIDFSKTKPSWRKQLTQDNALNIAVRNMQEIKIAYVRHHGHYNPLDKLLFQSLFQKLMTWAVPQQLFNPPKTKALTIFSGGHPDVTVADDLSVDVAISIDKKVNASSEIGIRTIAAGEYATLSLIDATIEECNQAWQALFNEWLPSSGYQPDDGAYYINHLNDPEQHPKKLYHIELYLPVKPL